MNFSSPASSMSNLPFVYTQSSMMRNQTTESEALSEYSEPQMLPTRALPPPFRQVAPAQSHISPTEMQPLIKRTMPFGQEVRDSPYRHATASYHVPPPPTTPQMMMHQQHNFIVSQRMMTPLPLPSPQCFVPSYNPDPTFIMQSASPSKSTETVKMPPTSTLTSSPSAKATNAPKTASRVVKLNKVTSRRYFVASLEQLAGWHKVAKKAAINAIYEFPAVLGSLSCKPSGVHHLILKSEKNNTLPLQAVYFPIDRELPKMKAGDLITCVGRMVGTNKLQVYDMWPTRPDDLAGLKRIAFLCQRTLQETDLAVPEP